MAVNGLTYLDAGGRRLVDCHECGQAARIDLAGDRLAVSCYAGCDQDLALGGYDLDRLRAECDGTSPAGQRAGLRLVPLAEFAAVAEPSAEPLLGSDDDAAFTAGGTVITYGDGGQGKTTLAIDGVAHLAAGVPWLGLAVPRPLRIVLIENEGPRGKFRQKLERKQATWTGPPFAHNVRVLEEPWGEFTFADDAMRSALARACAEFEAYALVIGPLVTVGAEGGGTPEEVARFETLLGRFRAEIDRPLLVWIAHHENKAGDVSGAWARLPDTLMHARIEGRATKLHWRKVRWSSELHDQHWTLRWTEPGEGLERFEEPSGMSGRSSSRCGRTNPIFGGRRARPRHRPRRAGSGVPETTSTGSLKRLWWRGDSSESRARRDARNARSATGPRDWLGAPGQLSQ